MTTILTLEFDEPSCIPPLEEVLSTLPEWCREADLVIEYNTDTPRDAMIDYKTSEQQ